MKYDGSISLVKIGDNNRIREYVTINRATHAGEATIVGDNNLLMAYVHVAHNCIIANQVVIANAVSLAGHVEIESNAVIGGVLGIHQFVRIGCYAMLGGMSRVVRGLNMVGLRRAGIPDLDGGRLYRELKDAYRVLYRSNLTLKEALSSLDIWADNEHIRHLQTFLQISSTEAGRRGPVPGVIRRKSSSSDT